MIYRGDLDRINSTMENIVKDYVKKNNIQGYLNNCKDSGEIRKMITQDYINQFEGDEFDDRTNDFEDFLETQIFQHIDMYNYQKEKENEDIPRIIERIEGCDFTIMRDKDGTISLKDLQGGYLGGYESYEGFETIMDANDRIEHFYDDYYFDML